MSEYIKSVWIRNAIFNFATLGLWSIFGFAAERSAAWADHKVWGLGSRVSGFGFRVYGSGFRICGQQVVSPTETAQTARFRVVVVLVLTQDELAGASVGAHRLDAHHRAVGEIHEPDGSRSRSGSYIQEAGQDRGRRPANH